MTAAWIVTYVHVGRLYRLRSIPN